MPDPTEPTQLTSAGLPRRRPRSQLIPGGPAEQQAASSGVPARSAEQVRGRLASYQQGVRQGRESRHRRSDSDDVGATSTVPPARANASARHGHDDQEEQ